MAIKASSFKAWCTDNISPQSWTRICLRCVEEIRAKGYNLKQMEDLDPDVELDSELTTSLNNALNDLYELSVDESALV
ncbi:MAG: hypothetical protein JXR10_01200 [Cyclobacteriaceae bacterium]